MAYRNFRIGICDDVEADREQMSKMVTTICMQEQIPVEIRSYASADSLLDAMQAEGEYDLLMLDVVMPDKNGMELARELRNRRQHMDIVFISSNREMALKGYEVSAVRYLAKPVQSDLLREALLFCYGNYQKKGGILIPFDGGMRRVSPADICYIVINGRKCHVIQSEDEWDTGLAMTDLEQMLDSYGFLRCHQSFLVNCSYIRTFFSTELELANGRRIPVSKHRVKEVRKQYFDYMSQ